MTPEQQPAVLDKTFCMLTEFLVEGPSGNRSIEHINKHEGVEWVPMAVLPASPYFPGMPLENGC
jgi:hypothetical protein